MHCKSKQAAHCPHFSQSRTPLYARMCAYTRLHSGLGNKPTQLKWTAKGEKAWGESSNQNMSDRGSGAMHAPGALSLRGPDAHSRLSAHRGRGWGEPGTTKTKARKVNGYHGNPFVHATILTAI